MARVSYYLKYRTPLDRDLSQNPIGCIRVKSYDTVKVSGILYYHILMYNFSTQQTFETKLQESGVRKLCKQVRPGIVKKIANSLLK